jgi:hypothetical protein
VNLFEIKLLPDDRDRYLRITAVRDRDPGFTTWTFRTPSVADFCTDLQHAADSDRAERPDLARVFRDWGAEMHRRNRASAEIAELLNAEDDNPFIGAEGIQVRLRTLADEAQQVLPEPLFEVGAALIALRDGRVVLTVETSDGGDSPIAMFRKDDITYLAFPGPSSTPGVGGTWEIGFRNKAGERRAIFHGPGLSLYPGDEASADAFIQASGLLSGDRSGRNGKSWRTQ